MTSSVVGEGDPACTGEDRPEGQRDLCQEAIAETGRGREQVTHGGSLLSALSLGSG